MSNLFWQFFVYSFLGFVLEVVFARVTHAKKQDRKCLLLLPLCPVYGLGALAITNLPEGIRQRPLLLFFFGALAATAAEYAVDWLCDTALGVRFWDYSALPWNVNGRVCLRFSFFWGLLSLGLTAWVHPAVLRWSAAIPPGWTFPVFLLFAADALASAWLLRTTGTTDCLRWYRRFPAEKKKTDG